VFFNSYVVSDVQRLILAKDSYSTISSFRRFGTVEILKIFFWEFRGKVEL
jgi:hypothetical protein